jgi:hypothetical protein
MTDHLTRLAARALGHTGVIHPRVPSRFEAAGGFELEEHLEHDAPATAVPDRPSVVAPEPAGRQFERAAHVAATTPPRVTRLSPAAAVAATASPAARGRTRDGLATGLEPTAPQPTAAHQREGAGGERRLETDPSRPAVIVELPARGEAPSVRVTIGRVEVRAVTPPPARPASARQRPPRLTLDEYVRLRDEGKR